MSSPLDNSALGYSADGSKRRNALPSGSPQALSPALSEVSHARSSSVAQPPPVLSLPTTPPFGITFQPYPPGVTLSQSSSYGHADIVSATTALSGSGTSSVALNVAQMDRQLRRKLLHKSSARNAKEVLLASQSGCGGNGGGDAEFEARGTPDIFDHQQASVLGGGHDRSVASSSHHHESGEGRRQMMSLRPAFHSRRSVKESAANDKHHAITTIWKPSMQRKSAQRKAYIVLLLGIFVGVGATAAMLVLGYLKDAPKGNYCLVLEDNFDGDKLDTSVWQFERQTGGFGNNEFEWTTDSTNNTYLKDGMLHIVPTLTSDAFGEAAITDGYTLNLTTQGVCTSTDYTQCGVASNASTGVILPPVQSARITTRGTKSIRYGRVEVRARMPTGDWIWPAIWMMPRDSVYGQWPQSGEIDLAESKGNKARQRSDNLANEIRSTLHWGPSSDQDSWWRTMGFAKAWRNFFDQQFYTFGLEWDETGLYTWQSSRIRKMMVINFNEDFYKRGQFPSFTSNGTQVINPWGSSQTPHVAPFDQDFYLIMNVAVGGTNGYFDDTDKASDGSPKPWSNSVKYAVRDFWKARDKWLPTWPTDPAQRGMVVDYVKMYQKC